MGIKPLHLRILCALTVCSEGKSSYYDLMGQVWPEDQYPRAYRKSSNGGPPGVAMVYGSALRELHEAGMIMRHRHTVGGVPQRFGQPDVWLLSDGRKALREAQ